MATDDMFVIMYRIIAYLYDCMKQGIEPSDDWWNAEAFGISPDYWTDIVRQLVDHGYVEGILVVKSWDRHIIKPQAPKVTMEGVQFAQENSMMAKAKKFLQDAKASVPFI